MAHLQDWELVFECPACRRSGRIAVSHMRSVLRCPYCRKRVVVGREGIHGAPMPVAGLPTAAVKKRTEPIGIATAHGKTARLCLLFGGLLVIAVLATLALLLVVRDPTFKSVVTSEALIEGAESFQKAWLAGDLERAEIFVTEAHRERLSHWARPRRAALVASFGERFDAKVTCVDVISQKPDEAEICVRFTVRGREQQTFQKWKLVGSTWRIVLDSLTPNRRLTDRRTAS